MGVFRVNVGVYGNAVMSAALGSDPLSESGEEKIIHHCRAGDLPAETLDYLGP